MEEQLLSFEDIEKEYDWAIEIVREHFARGLEWLSEKEFTTERYLRFKEKNDPIYMEILEGMNDEALAKVFTSYWMLGQTLATQSRFWLEDAIVKIILHQKEYFGREVQRVYSQQMLTSGLFEEMRTIAELGEEALEHTTSRAPWRVPLQNSAFDTVERIVGRQELERERYSRRDKDRDWKKKDLLVRDKKHFARVAKSIKGPPSSLVNLNCNLLVIEPDRTDKGLHAWGIRFVNLKSMGDAGKRKQERTNILRLYAYLVQEKVLREPESICVCVAELVPRKQQFRFYDCRPDYFSPTTYWSSGEFWNSIGVPYSAIRIGLRAAAQDFRKQLNENLRALMPLNMLSEEINGQVKAKCLGLAARAGFILANAGCAGLQMLVTGNGDARR